MKRRPSPSGLQGNAGSLEIRFTTSGATRRPRSAQNSPRLFSSARTAGFSQLDPPVLVQRDANSTVRFLHASATHYHRILNASCSVAFLVLHRARYKTGGKGFLLFSASRNRACWVEVWLNTISRMRYESTRFCLCHQFVKIVQRAIGGINRRIIRYVVTVIDTGET